MAANDSASVAGLFGAAAPSEAGDRATDPPAKKRIILKDNDSVAAVLFRPWEASPLDMTPPKELWSYIASGTKYVQYHSDLAAQTQHVDSQQACDYRVGVGLSRHAGLLVNIIERLRTDEYLKLILDKDVYKKAMAEAKTLLPFLQTLNFGKGSMHRGEQDNAGLRGLRKRSRDEEKKDFPSEPDIDAAVAEVFAWLERPASALRGLLVVLSAGGLPYAAMAGERTLRAWIQGGGATVERAQVAAKAVRSARMTGSEGSSSSASLTAAREQEISALFPSKRAA